MGSRQRRPGTTRTGRLVRGRRLDRNPLRRACDRAETLVLLLLAAVFLAGAPLAALAAGGWAHAAAQRAELAQAASRRQVTAVILAAPGKSTVGAWDLASMTQARWTSPAGALVTGQLPVTSGTAASTTVPIWVTGDGQLASHPVSAGQVASAALLGEAAGVAALTLVLGLGAGLARWSLNRRRMADWDNDWRATGPRWTTRA